MSADSESVSLSEPSYFGHLTFEEVSESDVFVRRFFVLDRTNARLEYYARSDDWVVCSFIRGFICEHLRIPFRNCCQRSSLKPPRPKI